jgi:hypothetical protein
MNDIRAIEPLQEQEQAKEAAIPMLEGLCDAEVLPLRKAVRPTGISRFRNPG